MSGKTIQPDAVVICAAILVFYAVFSVFNWAPLEEDSYIYFRFAENIAAGQGYVFNPGGEKIEGCSSFTWLFMLVLFNLAGINTLLAAKLAGIAFGCLSLIVIYKISRTVITSASLAALPCLLTAISVPFLMRNQMGLDESIYTLVFLTLVYACLRARYFKYWPFLFFLLIISRPEGMLTLLALLPVFFIYRDRSREIIAGVIIVAVLTGALLLFRVVYFHDFLPSPFYHKVFVGKYYSGLMFAHGFFKDYYAYFLLIPLLSLPFRKHLLTRQTGIILSFAAVHCLWFILAGACIFPFYRHLVPFIPLLSILAVSIAAGFVPRTTRTGRAIIAAGFILYALTALFLPQANWSPLSIWVPSEREPNFITGNIKKFASSPAQYTGDLLKRICDPRRDRDGELDMQARAGMFIRNNYVPGTTFLYDQMGRLPYNAGSEYIFRDSLGLIDKKIGRAIFSIRRSKTSGTLEAYDRISQDILQLIFHDAHFYNTMESLIDHIYIDKPDVLMCFIFTNPPEIRALSTDPRLIKHYKPIYFLRSAGVLLLERNELIKKNFNNADEILIEHTDEILNALPDHPWVAPFIARPTQAGHGNSSM